MIVLLPTLFLWIAQQQNMSSLLARKSRALLSRTTRLSAFRTFSSTANGAGGVTIDLDHFESGWSEFVDDLDEFKKSGTNAIHTFNKISPVGLGTFPKSRYQVVASAESSEPANALMLRSHKLQLDEIDIPVRAIARCGAGTNNIPVKELTELGIPVFNTPGANANAVKELILCGMLLGSRKIVAGINHMKSLGEQGLARERVGKK